MVEERVQRRLAAILSADVVSYSRLIRADEEGTLARLKTHLEVLIQPKIAEHDGRVVKLMGDGVLAEFASIVDAVRCAIDVQRAMAERNAAVPQDRRIDFRIGINLGDIVVEGEDIYGDGVNIAARLQELSDPGGLIISGTAFDHATHKVDVGFENLGGQQVKNIPEPVRAYRVLLDPKKVAGMVIGRKRIGLRIAKRWRWAIPAAAAAAVIGVAAGVLLSFEPWVPRVEAASEESMAYPLPEKPSIVVLPFDNVGSDPDQDHFSDGATGDIISHLSKLPQILVIDRHSSYAYKDKPVTVKQVAEELGVRYVLQGRVQRSGEKLRITTQLIDALSGRHVWSERYDREATDLFALQDDITRNVSIALEVELTEGKQAELRRQLSGENLEAWEYSSQAYQHLLRGTKESHAKARELIEKAITAGGEQSTFLVILSLTYLSDAFFGFSDDPDASFARGVEFANRALELDNTNPDVFILLSEIAAAEGRHDDAIAYSEKSVALAPNSADAHANLANKLSFAGRSEEAIPVIQKAMRLSPFYPDWYLFELATEYHFAGRLEEALSAYKKSAERSPDAVGGIPLAMLAVAAWELGRYEEARAAIADFLKRRPDFTVADYAKATSQIKDCCEKYYGVLRELGIPERPPLPLPNEHSR